jgi:hypothetical protein
MVDIIKKNFHNQLSNLSNISEIQKYIHKNWKRKHILSKNKNLLIWQHQFLNDKIDFLVKKKGKKIISLLGIINQSRNKKYSEISLAVWHSINKTSGLSLMINTFFFKNIKMIKATTISKNVLNLYRSLGFKVQNFNQYYLTNTIKKKQKITKGLIAEKFNSQCVDKKLIFKGINKIFNLNYNFKNKNYIKWRFYKHPIYEYYFLTENKPKLILICRIVLVKKVKFLSIVDYLGSFRGKNEFIKKIPEFLKIQNFHHLEFLHYGSEDNNILKSGLKKVNKNQILPLLTQPYTGLKKIDILCGYKTINKNQIIKIVRADGDADRPSL